MRNRRRLRLNGDDLVCARSGFCALRRRHVGCIDLQATRAAEVFEVLSARRNHRMVHGKRRGRNRHRLAIKRLGIAWPSCLLGDDGEVIERVGQIRMERTQFGFLNARGFSQQLIRRREVTSSGGAFRLPEHVSNVRKFRHGVHGVARQSDAGDHLIVDRGVATPYALESRAANARPAANTKHPSTAGPRCARLR